MSENPTVLVSGMFDLDNYGDLLFPLVARHRLEPHGYRVQAVAPSARRAALEDAPTPIDIGQMLMGQEPIAGILVGGGYVIHASSLEFMDVYETDGTAAWCGLGLWLGATLAAALRDVPIAWNAPGVPHPFAGRQRPLIAAALRAASYLSLRDHGSARLLAAPAEAALSIVPDPIADIAALWSKDSLRATYQNLLLRKGLPADARLLAIHVRNRSMRGLEPVQLGAMLRDFAAAQRLVPMLVAVGRSHDDPGTARRLAPHMGDPLLLLDDPLSLREITSVLAHSALYVGASLHGYIVGSAYDTPGVLVARPAYQKFSGFLDHTGRAEDLARDWPEALQIAARGPGTTPRRRLPAAVGAALDAHWQSLRAALCAPAKQREARRDFALELLRLGLRTEGPAWALEFFQNRAMRASRPASPAPNHEPKESQNGRPITL